MARTTWMFTLAAVLVFCWHMPAETQEEAQELDYQLEIASRVTEYVDELFQNFSDGYVEAEIALEKLSLWRNEYNKATEPVPEKADRLHELVNQLLSQLENYFIHYKHKDRENVNINSKIANLSFEIYKETIKLQY